jgi:LPXTG-site transpeptidase (sortase) family protein
MKSNFSFKNWLWFISGAVVAAFSIIVILLPDNTILRSVPVIPYRQVNSGLPIRLKIPTINVDATVEYVGVTLDGNMGVPKGPDDVAWFQFGPRPGDIGNAVIAGHYGWKNGIPAVFDEASKLQKGDNITIEDDKGILTTFVVRESRLLDEHADASSVFGSSDGKAHLNLITCEGVWNPATKSYSERLVVFADKK